MSLLPSVSVIIVSYNTRELTCDCIKSVLEQGTKLSQQIIVLDNDSKDGSADAVARQFPNIELIRSNENLGFAKGNNVAARQAHGDYILLLNPDTVVLDRAIENLISFAERTPEAMVWGGRTLHADKTLNEGSCWRFMSLWTIFASSLGLPILFPNSDLCNPESYGGWARDTVRRVDMVSGCFLLVKREFWEKLAGFDEKFYIYAEEADLCYRATQLGAAPMITPTATIIHLCGASTKVRADKLEKLWRGKATFLIKHWPSWKAKLGVSLMKMHAGIRWIAYGVAGRLTGNASYTQAASEWQTLLKSRASWENGYT